MLRENVPLVIVHPYKKNICPKFKCFRDTGEISFKE
jgi:hypothetical protein